MSSDHILDPESIAALNSVAPEDGGAFLRELLDIFLADTPARIAEVKATLAKHDAAALTRAAHSIKGAAGNFGAQRLAAVAHQIESAAKASDFPSAQLQIARLEAEYAAVQTAMEALRAS